MAEWNGIYAGESYWPAWRCWPTTAYREVIMENERPDPLAPPEGYAARQPGSEPVTHSAVCTFGACQVPPVFCLYLGDENEHIGHLDLCGFHCYEHRVRRAGIECTICRKPMKIIKMVPEDTADIDAGLQKLLDMIGQPYRWGGGSER